MSRPRRTGRTARSPRGAPPAPPRPEPPPSPAPPTWRDPWAWLAALAGFPLLVESTRQLVAWPDHSSDLGVFLFSALALHQASRRRLPGALAALLAALLCKELAIVTALLLPFFPPAGVPRRQRVRWAIAIAALLVVWGAAALGVRAHAHLVTPQALVGSAASREVSLGA